MIAAALAELTVPANLVVTISIPGGERIAERTLNGRLGIVGGLSILGTTGVVIPFSCAAWIDSIHRGIDVARASGIDHIAGATGTTSEAAVRDLYGLPEPALIEMGDFVGGMLKYLRRHPVPRVTIAGGFAKMTKLGQGLLDLHSGRGRVDFAWLAAQAASVGCPTATLTAIETANTAADALSLASSDGVDLGARIAAAAHEKAAAVLVGGGTMLDIAIFDRDGALVATTVPRPT